MTEPTGSASEPRERVIDLGVEVAGSPEEVWEAIATGPGITSWYVPSTVEERLGGAITNQFGEGPEMTVPGRVTAWEPPHRVRFEGADEQAPGLAFEWLVEARDQSSCVVRLVNSGFVEGTPWDDQYDGMAEGWQLFLTNLQLHRAHFPGRTGLPMLPMGVWPGPEQQAWATLAAALGLPEILRIGDRVDVPDGVTPALAGTVVRDVPGRVALLLDRPAAGTAFLACEAMGEQCGVSVWQYLYGDDVADLIRRDEPRWNAWLQQHGAIA
ncbi:MAG TPA: SRPBCC domain-containing protein [Microlunatus sp.]|nr:SRPBCC domain-containing protein [Microlunatus sp.]